MISPYDSDSLCQLRLRIHFLIWVLHLLFSSFSFLPICGEDQIERARHQFKGQTQVSASRVFTWAMTETLLNYWEMFYQSKDIMQPTENCIKLSLLHHCFGYIVQHAWQICNLGSTGDFNNLEHFLQLMFLFRPLKSENKCSRVTAVKLTLHKLGLFILNVFLLLKAKKNKTHK